ncbi:MAG: gamma carbonic anhydrase family protein [Bdellovibrionaceae bacterium]|nr:gamma carbonic anhydrase family protein [Pseudobdellovibrionaceae bacterium]MBX3035039.1 gamma carbonic anhydrase family protein [Pseudobdellovibrionaceae bacterium]
MKNLIPARGFTPEIGRDVFLAPNAFVIGDVKIGERASIWFNVTVRGDVMPIRIGAETNIQDGSVLHGTYGKFGCTLEDRVTIGHLVTLHGCHIGRETLIGMGCTVMDGAQVGEQCLIGAGSLVTEGMKIPPRHLAFGRPAKVVRPLKPEEIESLRLSADNYLLYQTWYEPTSPDEEHHQGGF